jgi:amidohydrolase
LDNGEGPEIAIMIEYDALPDVGHGCGHNLHGSLCTLAALALGDLKHLFKGKIYAIGTPNEEVDGAKARMADKGIFDSFTAALMMHSCGGGKSQANMDALSLRFYDMDFKGQAAHAVASPWEGRSALAAARKFIDLVDARRECFTPDIHVNTIITDGGKAPNIIPAKASLRVEFRTDSMAKLKVLDEMILKCARAAAMALDCEVSWKAGDWDFADMVRVKPLEEAMEVILSTLGEETEPVSPPIGSTDVGNVSYRCPALQPLISITREHYALHTPEFAAETIKPPAHAAMARGAEALALLALKLFNDGDFRRTVQEDFTRSRDGKLST